MKTILIALSIGLVFTAYSKNNNTTNSRNNTPVDTTGWTGTLIIGNAVRFLSDYSLPDTIASKKVLDPYAYNSSDFYLSAFPICYAQNYAPSGNYYKVQMTDSRPDSNSVIRYNIPSFSSFSNYSSPVDIAWDGISIPTTANISFNMTGTNSGTFTMLGASVVTPGDTVAFSFNGTFKNMPAY